MRSIFILFFAFYSFIASAGGDPLSTAIKISSYGMSAEQERIKIIAQNIANKDSTTTSPDQDPYRRQIVILENKIDAKLNAHRVFIKRFGHDPTQFKLVYDPAHPAADKNGYVKYPNIDTNIEIADSKDASRSYDANLAMLNLTKSMYNKTLDMLRP